MASRWVQILAFRRFQSRVLGLGARAISVSVLTILFCSGSPAHAGLSAEADSLDLMVRELAADGRFSEAAMLASELKELDASLGADPYILRWYDVWISTLEASSRLDDDGKQALADANALETTIKRETGVGRFSVAEQQIRLQMELRASALGPDHPEAAYSKISLSSCLMSLGRLWDAEEPAREAGRAIRDAFGDRHFLSLSALGMVAQIEVAQGEYESAQKLFDEIVTLRRNRFGKTDPMLATSLSALANVHLEQKSTLRAERLLREALNINRDGEFEWIPRGENFRATQKVELFRDLARVLLEKGDYAGASSAADQALDLLEKTGMDRPILTTDILGVTARALAETGAYEDAITTAARLLESRRDRVGSRHPEIVEALSELARIEGEAGQWESSAQNWERAHELAVEILGPEHPTTLELFDHLVAARLQLGAYTVVDSLLRASLTPERRSGTIQAMKNSGVLHLARANYETAEQHLTQSAANFEEARMKAGQGIDRATFGEAPYFFLAAAQLGQGKGDPAWNSVEKGQGRVLIDLLTEAGGRRLPAETNAALIDLYKWVDRTEREFDAIQHAAKTDESAQADLGAALDRKIQAQADLVALETTVAEGYPVPSGRPFELDRVQASLSEGSAVLGWLDVHIRPDVVRSWAYVVRPEGAVRWIELESSTSIARFANFRDRIAQTLDSVLGARPSASLDRESTEIWANRFAPLHEHLVGIDHLVVVGTGAMSGVPLESLRNADGNYLGERYSISYVPSATVHAWIRERARVPNETAESALFVGDPPFREEHLSVEQPTGDRTTSVAMSTLRGALSGNRHALQLLPRLWWSRQEVLNSAEHFAEASVLLGADASERELGRLAESGALSRFHSLHFATHALVDAQSPQRSALALSQVGLLDENEAISGDQPIEDGLLSARDIVRTWDLNAELIVLSACETGLGRRVVGEGYVGFSHAFLQAGANTVVASLWKVDDRATALLMSQFYEQWKTAPRERPLANALRDAQHWLRTYVEADGTQPYAHPAYWSGFVLIGNPG